MRDVPARISNSDRANRSDAFEFLENWYAEQCNGDWEHEFGVEIGTLDNPGWRVKIDLDGTDWEGQILDRQVVERTKQDWFHIWSDGHQWEAACGPKNLMEVLGGFQMFVSQPPTH